jgi:hypothetical protein
MKSPIIPMRADMRMSCQYITFAIGKQIIRDKCSSVFSIDPATLIDEFDGIFWEKVWKPREGVDDEVSISLSIHPIGIREFCELGIPEVEVFSSGLAITNSLEEGISLPHRELIVFFYLGELRKCPSEDEVDIVPPHTGREVEEIHIKRWDVHRPPWEYGEVLWLGSLRVLDREKVALAIVRKPISLLQFALDRDNLNARPCIKAYIAIEWYCSRYEMECIEDMGLARAVGTHHIRPSSNRYRNRFDTVKWMDGEMR